MKKWIALCVIAIGCLTSCSDDEPYVPPLNKLTKVVCAKNSSVAFVADITYDQDGQLNRLIQEKGSVVYTDNYIFAGNSVSVSGTKVEEGSSSLPFVHTVYTLDGARIVRKEEKQENKFMNNAVYTALTNNYSYSRTLLKGASQTIQWPKENGSGYEQRTYANTEQYSWENGDMIMCAFQKDEISLQYSSQKCPSNFPFRVVGGLQVGGFELITPLNFLYGAQYKQLPSKLLCYTVGNTSGVSAEYNFRYVQTSDYISGMTIQEILYATDTQEAAENVYEYTFSYNFTGQ